MPKKRPRKLRLAVKISLCILYIAIMAILVFCAFRLYKEDEKTVKWKDVTTTKEYSYIEISEMSEAFAKVNKDIQIHFVMEKEKTGEWHTYLIAIPKSDYKKYKSIIDYTYERTEKKPKSIKVYGYPKKITKDIKNLAIKNITNFIPIENQVVLDNKNFEEYLTNTYLDTTSPKTHQTDYIILVLLSLASVLFILIVFTLLDRDKIVDEVDLLLEKELEKERKNKNKKNKKNKVEKIEQTKEENDIEVL